MPQPKLITSAEISHVLIRRLEELEHSQMTSCLLIYHRLQFELRANLFMKSERAKAETFIAVV
jgi:hypothetical protein